MQNEAHFRQEVGEDGSMQKEAHVRRRVRKDGEDKEDAREKQEKGSRTKDTIYSTILVSVAVIAVVGVVIAKIALARKVLRGA